VKSQTISVLIIVLALIFASVEAQAQCPASKYGLNPVWPVSWSQTDRQNWYFEMATHGQGFQSDGRTWRQLQVMMDSNQLIPFRDEVSWAKSNGGIEKYLFQLKNPVTVANPMPPVWCGNPLTDTNTTKAMFRFIVALLDTMHPVLDYFVLGSESDVYFKSRPAERDSFFVLAGNVSDYIDLNYPTIKFGVGVSMQCSQNTDTLFWNRTLTIGDIMSVSWWPLINYYADTAEVNAAGSTIATLVAECGSKPVVISDCGLPTALMPTRSDVQSEFVRNTFLHTMNEPLIEAVGYYYLGDFDSTAIYDYQNLYLTYASEFYESIKSRGLLDSLGNPKPAYDVYLSMLDTVCAHAEITDQHLNLEVTVWPNPAVDKIFFDRERFSSYSIYATSGQLICSNTLSGKEDAGLNISHLPEGAYFLVLFSENQSPENHLFIKNSLP